MIAPNDSIIPEIEPGSNSYVYSREFDEIFYESDTSNEQLCNNILNTNYAKFLKGIDGRKFKPLLKDQLYGTNINSCVTKNLDGDNAMDGPINENKSTLAARCPTYLSYVRCIYSNYIQPLSYSPPQNIYSNDYIKLIDDGINNVIRSTFVKSRGGDLSFHVRQVLFQFCHFINHACPKLLNSFAILNTSEREDWYKNSACSAFDYITPISNLSDLFDTLNQNISDHNVGEYVKLEIDAYINFEYRCDYLKNWQRGSVDNNILFSSIGALYDVPINNQFNINNYIFQYCVELCGYLSQLSNLKKFYSKKGLARFYFICANRELSCNNVCGVCN